METLRDSQQPTTDTRGSGQPRADRCGAKLRRSDPPRYCCQFKLTGANRCKLHGGMTPRGVASANFRHGGWSMYVPERMQKSYADAIEDPEILSLRKEIAYHRAQADDLRRRLDEAEPGGQALQTAWRDFRNASRSNNPDRLADAMTRLDQSMSQRAAEDSLRRELRAETDIIQKLTRNENDRMEQLHQMISREQALTYMRGLAVSVKEAVEQHVLDAAVKVNVLRAVSARFEQLNDRRGDADARARRRSLVAGDPATDD